MGTDESDTKTWKDAVRKARAYREKSLAAVSPEVPEIPHELPLNVSDMPRQLLNKDEVKITEMLTEELLPALASGRLTSEEVVRAFLRRAAIAQKLVNCITELMPENALKRARELDEYLAKNNRRIGPLHGLPISVKEHLIMKGYHVNYAACSAVDNIAEANATILNILWDAGCVFYVRTTEPQTIMHLETDSNLYGVTVNPFNRNLTAGGSSGGEGALLALRGSCLGLGTDIGGSVRSPAANNGVYSLRPTSMRIPLDGQGGTSLGFETILGVIGPMSTSLYGVELVMKVVLDSQPWLWLPSLVPLPWKTDENPSLRFNKNKKLKVGILWDDGIVKPHPPVLRALRETANKLNASAEFDVVDWIPYKHELAWPIISHLFFPDGGADEALAIDSSGEPWLPLSRWVIKENEYVQDLSVHQIWYWTEQRENYRIEYAKHWNATATGKDDNGELSGVVDVILCPVGPGPAPPHDCSRYWGYTSQWNLLDYPAAVFPVTTVDPMNDTKDSEYKPRNKDDQYNYDLYEPSTYVNAPVGLQVVGRKFDEEKVLKAVRMIEKLL